MPHRSARTARLYPTDPVLCGDLAVAADNSRDYVIVPKTRDVCIHCLDFLRRSLIGMIRFYVGNER